MDLLLDTHTYLWFNQQQDLLSDTAYSALTDSRNDWFLSIVSIWEIQIKMMRGKLELDESLKVLVEGSVADGIQILDLTLGHIFELGYLPSHHKDPFDRVLVAQALDEDLTVVTIDEKIGLYSAAVLW